MYQCFGFWFYEVIKSYPRVTTINEGIKPFKEYNGDCIVALGGGSAIIAVPTVSAAGSEVNAVGVLTNWEIKEKSLIVQNTEFL